MSDRKLAMLLTTKDDYEDHKLVSVPYDATFDSKATMQSIYKAFGLLDHSLTRIESIELQAGYRVEGVYNEVGSHRTATGGRELRWHPCFPQWKLPLDMRPVDLELSCNEMLRGLVFKQQYAWRVNIVTLKQFREHE
jgi:hypothetical protein